MWCIVGGEESSSPRESKMVSLASGVASPSVVVGLEPIIASTWTSIIVAVLRKFYYTLIENIQCIFKLTIKYLFHNQSFIIISANNTYKMKVVVCPDLGREVLTHKRLQHRRAPSPKLLNLAVARWMACLHSPYTDSESRSDFLHCISNTKEW